MDREKVIKWLDVCKTADKAVGLKEDYPCRECPYKDSSRCMRELVADALAMLKEQEAVKCPTDHDNELTRHVLFTARQHVEECLNKAKVRYGRKTAEFLMFAKGIRDACWAIDELISTHNEGTGQNDE